MFDWVLNIFCTVLGKEFSTKINIKTSFIQYIPYSFYKAIVNFTSCTIHKGPDIYDANKTLAKYLLHYHYPCIFWRPKSRTPYPHYFVNIRNPQCDPCFAFPLNLSHSRKIFSLSCITMHFFTNAS